VNEVFNSISTLQQGLLAVLFHSINTLTRDELLVAARMWPSLYHNPRKSLLVPLENRIFSCENGDVDSHVFLLC
jgi:hypothetical protein